MMGRRGGGSTLTVGGNGAKGRVHEPHKGVPPAFPSPLTRSADADLRKSRPAPPCAQNCQLPHTIGLIDETSDPKKGDKTPGVQKQWCGRLGKTENCMVTVHLGLARGDFHSLLDGELFLPESWAADRDRCREAGIPDTMVYRPKWKIALELFDRAVGNGIRFE